MSIVYVVQNAHRLNRRTGELEPRFDLEPARRYGELDFIYTPTCSPFDTEELVDQAYEVLCNYNPEEDYLLPVGGIMLVCAASIAIRDCSGGRFKMLQWSNSQRGYIPVEFNL